MMQIIGISDTESKIILPNNESVKDVFPHCEDIQCSLLVVKTNRRFIWWDVLEESIMEQIHIH